MFQVETVKSLNINEIRALLGHRLEAWVPWVSPLPPLARRATLRQRPIGRRCHHQIGVVCSALRRARRVKMAASRAYVAVFSQAGQKCGDSTASSRNAAPPESAAPPVSPGPSGDLGGSLEPAGSAGVARWWREAPESGFRPLGAGRRWSERNQIGPSVPVLRSARRWRSSVPGADTTLMHCWPM